MLSQERPYFLVPEVERVFAVVMAIAQELAVARARIDTLERLLERKGIMTREEVETFQPSPSDIAERAKLTQDYVSRVLELLQRELNELRSEPDNRGSQAR